MNGSRLTVFAACCLLAIGWSSVAVAGETDYLKNVKSVLKRKCFSCHGALKQESSLRLDTVRLMKKGGESGPIINVKNHESSLLWQRVSAEDEALRMPPEGEPLSETELEHLKNWLAAGAIGVKGEQPMADPAQHWAFQPLQQITPPTSKSSHHPIDSFIDLRLKNYGLARSSRVDAISLVRRMFLDLHGLPPTPEDIEKWVPVVHNETRKKPAC